MKRRHFLALGGAAATWPFAARAQKAPVVVGLLAAGAAASINSAFHIKIIEQGLGNSGLVEDRDYRFEARFAAGHYERFPGMARELAQAGARVILADTTASVRAAQRLLPPVPVVMISIQEPVETGLIASLAKPGGSTTGLAMLNGDLASRMLQLQRTILPGASSIALLYNPENPANPALVKDLRTRATALGISVRPVEFRSRDELEAAFGGFATRPPDALHVMTDAGTSDLTDRIAALALAHRLPAFSNAPEFVGFGGLMAYGASREQLYLRAGAFVKKILDGANPDELAVEQPSRTELWINLKTAKALDLTLSASLLATADKVIE